MSRRPLKPGMSRRNFLRFGLGTAAAAGVGLLGSDALLYARGRAAPVGAAPPPKYYLAGTDGWISLPKTPAIPPFHPDPYAPDGLSTYIFGFANTTGLSDTQRAAQKMQAQASAPLMYFDEGQDYVIRLTNLGLQMRPDLVDSHTIHWHGFKNQIPMFDGEPSSSISVPIGRTFDYFFHPRDPGTYMFHCHVEDTEHVHMGMTGMIYVRAAMNTATQKYAYNHPSTAYEREFAMFLSEVWAEAHWDDAHIQLPEWSDYVPDFCLLNGRVYPDTLEPPSPGRDAASGDILPPPGRPDLQYQPISSLVKACAGDRVLLRFANLGYTVQSMTLAGIKLHVVGKDATLLRGADGTDSSFVTHTITLGPGEAVDAIFTAPPYSGANGSDGYDTYLLYNREYAYTSNGGSLGRGGQTTEVRVYGAGKLAAQQEPNT